MGSRNSKDTETTTLSTSSVTQEPSGLFNSVGTKEILLILLLFVVVVCIIVAVILIIRKRKYNRLSEESPMTNTIQSEMVSSEYATVVPAKRPSEVTLPPGNTIYAEVEMIQQQTSPTSDNIYANVQPTSEADDMGKSFVYADLDFPHKHQQNLGNADPNAIYSEAR